MKIIIIIWLIPFHFFCQARKDSLFPLKNTFSIYTFGGIASNYSKTTLKNSSDDQNFTFKTKPLTRYTLGVGFNFLTKENIFFALGIKQISIGNINSISSLSDSLKLNFTMSSQVYRVNTILDFGIGYKFLLKKLTISPSIGVDYFINTRLNHSSEGSTGDSSKKSIVKVYNNSQSIRNSAFLFRASFNIGYQLKLKDRYFVNISYNTAFGFGTKNIYSTEMEFVNGTKKYILQTDNKCIYLSHTFMVTCPIFINN